MSEQSDLNVLLFVLPHMAEDSASVSADVKAGVSRSEACVSSVVW